MKIKKEGIILWDTSKDYRLLLGQKTIDLFIRTIRSGSFRGKWNKKLVIENAESMESDFQSLIYSYLEVNDLANSPDIVNLEEKSNFIIEGLGGNEWSQKFITQTPKDEKEKTEESVAKARFFIDTILGLKKRILLGPINDPIVAIDIIVGEIMSVSQHPQSDSLMICNVNIGNRAIKVVTNDLTVKDNNKVAISLLPPETFMGIASSGMFLGTDDGILKDVEGEIGSMPKGIPLESLNETRNLIESFLNK